MTKLEFTDDMLNNMISAMKDNLFECVVVAIEDEYGDEISQEEFDRLIEDGMSKFADGWFC